MNVAYRVGENLALLNKLNDNIDIIENETYEYLNSQSTLRVYHIINGQYLNVKKYHRMILFEHPKTFGEWFHSKTDYISMISLPSEPHKFLPSSGVDSKIISLGVNASNSLVPDHNMRTKNGIKMLWENCFDTSQYFKETNKIFVSPKTYSSALMSFKTTFISEFDFCQPYVFLYGIKLTDGLVRIHYNGTTKVIRKGESFMFYFRSDWKFENLSDLPQIIYCFGNFMFDYDIKNYNNPKSKWQEPKL